MNKLRLNSRRQVFRKYGNTLRVPASSEGSKKKELELHIVKTLPRIGRFSKNPAVPFETVYYSLRSKVRLDAVCAICGSDERIEMHHRSALKRGRGGLPPTPSYRRRIIES